MSTYLLSSINSQWKVGKVLESADEVVHFGYMSGESKPENKWIKTGHDKIAPLSSMTKNDAIKFYSVIQRCANVDSAIEAHAPKY